MQAPDAHIPEKNIEATNDSMSHSLVAKLNRTDTTLDLSQKAEKGMKIEGHSCSPILNVVEQQRWVLRVLVRACHVGHCAPAQQLAPTNGLLICDSMQQARD